MRFRFANLVRRLTADANLETLLLALLAWFVIGTVVLGRALGAW